MPLGAVHYYRIITNTACSVYTASLHVAEYHRATQIAFACFYSLCTTLINRGCESGQEALNCQLYSGPGRHAMRCPMLPAQRRGSRPGAKFGLYPEFTTATTASLTLSTHAPEGYCSCPVCLSVCLSVHLSTGANLRTAAGRCLPKALAA